MLDTLMALWNQDRRKRALQAILTFFLMCIGISLLLVITSHPAESQYQPKVSLGSTQPTVPTFNNTVVPDLTPTVSVVVGTQLQPKSIAKATQPTPAATTTQPCSTTPSSDISQASTFYADTVLQPSPTPHSARSTPHISTKRLDGGGGPVNTITPVLPTPTPVLQNTPTPASAQHGWVSNCTTSNSLSTIARSDVITLLAQNIWFILGSALLCTTLFYALLFIIKRRLQI